MLRRKGLWRAISLATIFLLAFSLVGSAVADTYRDKVNEVLRVQTSRVVGGEGPSVYYSSDYDDLNAMYQAKVSLLRDIADEGVVLLKNEGGVLPVAEGKITILGEEALAYCGGTGGGAMEPGLRAMSATLSGAFRQVGFTVNTDAAQANGSGLVLVVLGRAASEGTDAPRGSLAITAAEESLIAAAKQSGAPVAVLLSGDQPIDAAGLKNDSGIAAVLHMGNVGYRGAYGIADVVSGKVSPSGRMVETYTADSASSPAMQNFGSYTYTNAGRIKASQAKNYVSYNEGIYVDYRYYETRYEDTVLGRGNSGNWSYDSEVVWPFGYGLSYTTFSQTIDGVTFDDAAHTAAVTVTVTNTGSAAGKEVVQVYAQTPYTDYDRQNKVEKSAVQLAGFEKTGELAPGERETVTVTVPLQWLAAYDYTGAKGYIMDAGDYYFSLGDAHQAVNNILAAKGAGGPGDTALTYKWTVDALDTATYRTSVYTGAEITNRFADADINYYIPGAVTYLSRADWQGTFPTTLELEASADMISFLNDTKRYENGVWNDSAARAAKADAAYRDADTQAAMTAAINAQGTVNAVSMRGKPYDDAGWDEILDSLTTFEMSQMVSQGYGSIKAAPSVTFPAVYGDDGPIGLKARPYLYSSIDSATGEKTPVPAGYTVTDSVTGETITVDDKLLPHMYMAEPVLGATFNKELARRQGDMMGEDGLYTGSAYIWAPGANLHRTPYGGRNSEYVSADPVLTSMLLAQVTGAAGEKGMVMEVKHYALNEQEQNRIGVATFSNEQAIRELYLRAFEGIMTYGKAGGLMSSYNRLGLLATCAEYDLNTGVLREEWGSQAYVISDWGAPTAGLYDGNASIVSGLSVMLNNGPFDDSSRAYVNQTLTPESIKADPVLLTAVREACHRILYNFIHSGAVNGVSASARVELLTPWWQTALTAMKIVFGVAAAGSTLLYLAAANKKKEEK